MGGCKNIGHASSVLRERLSLLRVATLHAPSVESHCPVVWKVREVSTEKTSLGDRSDYYKAPRFRIGEL